MDPEPVAQEEPHTQGTPASASASTSEFDFEFDPVPPTGYTPTPEAVFVVQGILTQFAPPELGLYILSLADYRPRVCARRHEAVTYEANDFWRPGPEAFVAGLYLRTPALRSGIPVRASAITFQLRASDQGWADFGGHGTYRNSHTWFEASILRRRPGHHGDTGNDDETLDSDETLRRPFNTIEKAEERFAELGWDLVRRDDEGVGDGSAKTSWFVHTNITARAQYHNYRVRWVRGVVDEVPRNPRVVGDGRGFLDALRPGDRVVLWALAEVSGLLISLNSYCIGTTSWACACVTI